MSLRFHYKLVRIGHSVFSLGGRWVRPRPLIGVTLVGPRDTRAREAIVDTASDDSVFPEALAAILGIDLTKAPMGSAAGGGMQNAILRYAKVTLRLTDGKEQREWRGWIGFTPVKLDHPILGFAGCLQFFTATFHGDLEEVELAVNRLYPGT